MRVSVPWAFKMDPLQRCSLFNRFPSKHCSSSAASSRNDRRPHLRQAFRFHGPEGQSRPSCGAPTKVQDRQVICREAIVVGGARGLGGRPRRDVPFLGDGRGNFESRGNRRGLPHGEETTRRVDGREKGGLNSIFNLILDLVTLHVVILEFAVRNSLNLNQSIYFSK